MDTPEVWLTPLLILPGVALLIMSTSLRYVRVHEEIHHILEHQDEQSEDIARQLYRRSRLFRNALVFLYSSVSIFSLAGLMGGLLQVTDIGGYWGVTILTGLGIFFLLLASLELIREAYLSLDIIRRHFKSIGMHADSYESKDM